MMKKILWIKCTSHGRGYIYRLEKYIKKCGHVLIGNTNELVNHNTCDFVIANGNLLYDGSTIDLNEIDIAMFIFCPEKNVLTKDCEKYLIDIENILTKYKNIYIINRPSNIIMLNSKVNFYTNLKNNNISNIPKFDRIYNILDIDNIDYFPLILRQDNLYGGDCMTICENKIDLLEKYTNLKSKNDIFTVEFKKSEFKNYKNVLLRIIVVNKSILTYYAVEGAGWNVHTSTGYDKSTFLKINYEIEELIDISLVKKIINIIGPGTYAFDCIICKNKIFFVEANNKLCLAKYQIKDFNDITNSQLDRFKCFIDDDDRNKLTFDAIIKNIKYIPFGYNCIPANILKKIELKEANILLDHITTNPKGILKLLKSNDTDYIFNKNDLCVKNMIVVDNNTGFKYNHQFINGLDDYDIEKNKLNRKYNRLKYTLKNIDNLILITISNWKNIDDYFSNELYNDLYEINNQIMKIREGKSYKWLIFSKYLNEQYLLNCEFINLGFEYVNMIDDDTNRIRYENMLEKYIVDNVIDKIDFKNKNIVNNNIIQNDICDGYECIHGNNCNTNEIEFTIFLVTVNGHQLKYALESINNLPTNVNIKIHIVYKICPTSVAYEQMQIRCNTKYYIQFDEDMIIFSEKWKEFMDECKCNLIGNIFNLSFRLIDVIDGVGKEKWLYGIKCFRTDIMKDIRYDYATTSVDRSFNKIALEKGLIYKLSRNIVGTHAKNRNELEIFIKSGKFISSMLNPKIKISSIDVIRVINKLYNNGKICNKYIIYDCFKRFGSNVKNVKYIEKKIQFICDLYNEKTTYGQIKKYNFNVIDVSQILKFEDNTNILNIDNDAYYSIYGIIYFILKDFKYKYDEYPIENFNLIKR
jgi:hypothetical protein